jgi:hypothetical protein
MVFWLMVAIGLILLFVGTYYLVLWLNKRDTQLARQKILSGTKPFIAHWTYEANQIADVQPKGGTLKVYRKRLPDAKEVYICSDGLLIGDVCFINWKRFAEFQQLEIVSGNPLCILFKIEYEVGESKRVDEFLIPIPLGKEAEAEAVLEELYGIVRWDH